MTESIGQLRLGAAITNPYMDLGAQVRSVVSGGFAESAGVLVGDCIISICGQAIRDAKSVSTVLAGLSGNVVADELTITVRRAGDEVVLGPRVSAPSDIVNKPSVAADVPRQPGESRPVDGSESRREVKDYLNGYVRGQTVTPYGGLLRPSPSTGTKAMTLFEAYATDTGHEVFDGAQYVVVSQSGVPRVSPSRGESVLSEWSWFDTDYPMKVSGVWFHNGQPRSGVRAQALVCYLAVTDLAVRVGMRRGFLPKKGPWVYDDDDGKMAGYNGDDKSVFAAVFPYDKIEMIECGKHFFDIHSQLFQLNMLGKIKNDAVGPDGKSDDMNTFGVAVTKAIVSRLRISDDPVRRSAGERAARTDFVSAFASRRGSKVSFR